MGKRGFDFCGTSAVEPLPDEFFLRDVIVGNPFVLANALARRNRALGGLELDCIL